jgi:hypothetical protein
MDTDSRIRRGANRRLQPQLPLGLCHKIPPQAHHQAGPGISQGCFFKCLRRLRRLPRGNGRRGGSPASPGVDAPKGGARHARQFPQGRLLPPCPQAALSRGAPGALGRTLLEPELFCLVHRRSNPCKGEGLYPATALQDRRRFIPALNGRVFAPADDNYSKYLTEFLENSGR